MEEEQCLFPLSCWPAWLLFQDSKHDSASPIDFQVHFSFVDFVIGISSHSLTIGCVTVFVFISFFSPQCPIYIEVEKG